MSENTVDRKSARIQVTAEEARKTADARIEQEGRRAELAVQQKRAQLALEREKRLAKQQAKREARFSRRQARQQFTARVNKVLPTVGRRVMITGPILAPMTVAWIGQISFAMDTLKWVFIGALVFAAAWELTTAFAGWMFHQARKDGDRGLLFRIATWIFAASAGGMNYWHALDGASIYKPTPKAVSYGAMSLVGIALWELYSSLIHRKHLREAGIVPSARPRFGILRWVRFTRITWHAWSLSVRLGIKTVDEAWSLAVAEIDRRKAAKDKRPTVRVVVAKTVVRSVVQPKTKVRLFWTDQSATTLTATVDHPGTTSIRSAVATAIATGRIPETTTGRRAVNDHPQATSDHPVATTHTDRSDDHDADHTTGRSRPPRKTTKTTGRSKNDQPVGDHQKSQPTAQDNADAVAAYLKSVKDGRPLSQRALARRFGFSKTWARDRIQEAGPQPVGGGRRTDDHSTTTTPKDHPATSEVKTG